MLNQNCKRKARLENPQTQLSKKKQKQATNHLSVFTVVPFWTASRQGGSSKFA